MKVWIDHDGGRVTVNEQEVWLTPTELALFLYLWNNQDKVCSQEELLTRALTYHEDSISRMISQYISYLRKKLAGTALAEAVQTKRGYGYRIILQQTHI